MFTGAGTVLNIVTVLIGTSLGLALGQRFSARTRELTTDAIGLITLLVAGLTAADVNSSEWKTEVGNSAPVLIVLGALLLAAVIGSWFRLDDRITAFATRLSTLLPGSNDKSPRTAEAFLTSSLVFCTGPLTILGALSDGLGNGIDLLVLKSTLDGVTAIALAAALGAGVYGSLLAIITIQGTLTLVGLALGEVLSAGQIDSMSVTGGLLLLAIGLRLLKIREIRVGDLLPALAFAPLLTALVALVR